MLLLPVVQSNKDQSSILVTSIKKPVNYEFIGFFVGLRFYGAAWRVLKKYVEGIDLSELIK